MKILIDTKEPLSHVEIDILRVLLPTEKEQKKPNILVPIPIRTYPWGQAREVVLKALENLEIATIRELSKFTGMAEGTVYNQLNKLRKEKVVETSIGTIPKKFFIRQLGNPELKEVLQECKGKKIGNLL